MCALQRRIRSGAWLLTGKEFSRKLRCQENTLSSQRGGLGRQVGEWELKLQARQQTGENLSDAMAKATMKIAAELMLSAPVKLTDGTTITGPENIFRAAHPSGKGLSVCMEDVELDWKPEAQTRTLGDIHKFRVTYVLYWQGIIRPAGWTRLRMAYNLKIDSSTSHEILESTGTTNREVGEMAFGVGVLLGQAAMESMLGK